LKDRSEKVFVCFIGFVRSVPGSRRRKVPREGGRRRVPRRRLEPQGMPKVRRQQEQAGVRVGVPEIRVLVKKTSRGRCYDRNFLRFLTIFGE
jgi:hypothetical protein